MICTPHQIYLADKIISNEMGEDFSTDRGDGGWENLKEQKPLVRLGYRRENNIKIYLQEIKWGHRFDMV
jgi:hypothetical protein